MNRKQKNWLQRPNVTWNWVAVAMVLWTIGLLMLDRRTRIIDDLETRVSRPLDFRIRDQLGHSPELHPSIKVFGIDDSTVAWMGSASPDIMQWATLLESFARARPAAIIIDGLFSIASFDKGMEKEAEAAIDRLARLQTPVIVGSYIAPRKIDYRVPIDPGSPHYDLLPLVEDVSDLARQEVAEDLTLEKRRTSYIYGPDPRLRRAFTRIGHVMYAGDSKAMPWYRLGPHRALPHFMVLAADKKEFVRDEFYLNGTKVWTYPDGAVPLDFPAPDYLAKVTRSLRRYFVEAGAGNTAPDIRQGDYIYIMPSYYTGNADFKLSPFGPVPAGFAHLAFLNSMVKGQWLKPLWFKEVMLILAGLLGALIAVKCGPVAIPIFMLLGVVGWLVTAAWMFSAQQIIVPWLLPTMAYLGVMITIFIEKSRVAEKKAQFIYNALDGAIDPQSLSAIARKPEQLNFDAREQVVTVMFIDVVGFSLMAENQLPRIAFDSLKELFAEIATLVHKHGGIVNKTLGDGLLVFFGYSLERDEILLGHGEKALGCALEIQEMNLPRTLEAGKRGHPVYPLRIGINTSSVFLGNLGTDDRIDFTVVGNGVNFAKRLEGACQIHSIMMGVTTKDLVETLDFAREGLTEQYIKIKHHSDMIQVWGYDPFHHDPDLRAMAMDVYQQSTRKVRDDDRWSLVDTSDLVLRSSVGAAELVNFSDSGMNLQLATGLVRDAHLDLNIDSVDGSLGRVLQERGLNPLRLQVVWCFEEGEQFVHGMRFKNIDRNEAAWLCRELRRFGSVRVLKDEETQAS